MAEEISFYGRLNGRVRFSFGPKQFYADWGGAFTALEVAKYITKLPEAAKYITKAKLPEVNISKRWPTPATEAGAVAEKAKLLDLMDDLELSLILLNIDNLMINATKVNLLSDETIPPQLIRFSPGCSRLSKLVCDALCKMSLNSWGVVQVLSYALSEFGRKGMKGNISASVFFKI